MHGTAYLEVWAPGGAQLVPLGGERVTIGRGPGNDVVLAQDPSVSSLHAVVDAVRRGAVTMADLPEPSLEGRKPSPSRLHKAVRRGHYHRAR